MALQRCAVPLVVLVGVAVLARAADVFPLPPENVADFAKAGALPAALCGPCSVNVSFEGLPRVPVPGTALSLPDVTQTLQAAVNKAGPGCSVRLPADAGFLSAPVVLRRGVQLSGAGAGSSVLYIANTAQHEMFVVAGALSVKAEANVTLAEEPLAMPEALAAAAADLLAAGSPVFLNVFEANTDSDLVAPWFSPDNWNPSWAVDSRGGLFQVLNVTGTVPVLRAELPLVWTSNCTVRVLDGGAMMSGVSITDMTLVRPGIPDDWAKQVRKGTPGSDGMRTIESFVSVNSAFDCSLLRLEMVGVTRAGIWVETSAHVTIRDVYVHDATLFYSTGGGQGYGVVLGQWTTSSLVESCSFNMLRHAMVIKQGANSNVLAYSWSGEEHSENCDLGVCIKYACAGFAAHGHYASHNLVEGCVVNRLGDSDWYGPCPANTFYRNFFAAAGSSIAVRYKSQDALLVDNFQGDGGATAHFDDDVTSVTCVGNARCSSSTCTTADAREELRADGGRAGAACQSQNAQPQPQRPDSFYRAQSLSSAPWKWDFPAMQRESVPPFQCN